MKSYFFHLMPYSHISVADLDKHDTAWLCLRRS